MIGQLRKYICTLCYLDANPIQENLLDEITNIVTESWAEAQSKGWRITTNRGISPDGRPICLCPNHAREAYNEGWLE